MVSVDFTGTDPQVEGSINAVEAITYSACFYVFRCLLTDDVPATAGLMRPDPGDCALRDGSECASSGGGGGRKCGNLATHRGCFAAGVGAGHSGANSGSGSGNHEQSHDRGNLIRAPASPLPTTKPSPAGWERRPTKPGVSGVHTHMTNSLNTPAEALEYSYPLRVRQYSLRRGSGGTGKYRGGDGIVREIEVLTDAEVTLLADRRKRGPWGLSGGREGASGKTSILRQDGSVEELPGKFNVRLSKGERIRIETPGGGGWGKPKQDS